MQTLDQQIAQATHEHFAKEFSYSISKELRGAVKKTATRVRTSGIGVTLAFCAGKGGEHQQVAAAWCTALKVIKQPGMGKLNRPEDLLAAYQTADFTTVRRLGELSERILEWMAKWADAYKDPSQKESA